MQRRVVLFTSAIIAALVLLIGTGWTAWLAADQLGSRLSVEEVSSFRLGDTFSADLHELRSLFRRYEATRDDSKWVQFATARSRLDEWLKDQRRAIRRPAEVQILSEIQGTLDSYWQESLRLREMIQLGASHDVVAPKIVTLGDLAADMAHDTRRLLSLREQALQTTAGDARDRLGRLTGLLAMLLAIIVLLAAVLAILVYRDLIQPLRLQLVETRNLVERHEKLAALGVLAAGVAHEIRNPLTAIKARLFTQQKRLSPGSPAAEDASIIHSEIHRLERIVREFLEFARPADPTRRRTSSRDLLVEVQKLLASGSPDQPFAISLEPGPDLPLHIDPNQIKQVLINLVRNAIEATGPGGQVRLRCQVAERRFAGTLRPAHVLEVIDNGPGIADEARDRLFDPFFTTKADGTGLGLAIAARIVERHGGALEYQSSKADGTCFSIALPASA